jgi:hypothetical protein
VISTKAYYNLGIKLVKDISTVDTPSALAAIFKQVGWKYYLNKELSKDLTGKEI